MLGFFRLINRTDVGLGLIGAWLYITATDGMGAGFAFIVPCAVLRFVGRRVLARSAPPSPTKPRPRGAPQPAKEAMAKVAVAPPANEQGSLGAVFQRLDPRWQSWIDGQSREGDHAP